MSNSNSILKYLSNKRKTLSSSSASDSCTSPESDNKPSGEKEVGRERKKQKRDSAGSVSEEEMSVKESLEELKGWLGEQLVGLSTKDDTKALVDEVARMREDMNSTARRLEDKMDKLEGEIFDLKNEKDALKTEVDKLREENRDLHRKIEQSKKENVSVRGVINDHEQHGRQFNLRVFGIPEVKTGSEDVGDCVKKCVDVFSNKVGVKVEEQDVEMAHRIGRPGGGRPRAIIVRFHSRRLRGQVLAERRKLKQSGVSIGEDLTAQNYKLLKSATQHSAVMSAWSSHGKVIAKVKNGQIVKLDISMNIEEVLTKALG